MDHSLDRAADPHKKFLYIKLWDVGLYLHWGQQRDKTHCLGFWPGWSPGKNRCCDIRVRHHSAQVGNWEPHFPSVMFSADDLEEVSKLWLTGQIGSTICFCMAHEGRMIFNIFKWLKNNQNNNKSHKFHISVFIIHSCWDTAIAMGLHVIYECFQLPQSRIVVAETIRLQRRKYLLSGLYQVCWPLTEKWVPEHYWERDLDQIKKESRKKIQMVTCNACLGSRDPEAVRASPPPPHPRGKARGISRKSSVWGLPEPPRIPSWALQWLPSPHPPPAFSNSRGTSDGDLVVLSLSWGPNANQSEGRMGRIRGFRQSSDCPSFWPPVGSRQRTRERQEAHPAHQPLCEVSWWQRC